MTEAMVSPEPAPYTLVQIEQPPSFAIPKLSVSWDNLSFTVKIKNPTTKKLEEKSILKGVSGEAHPGELMVLMGPSGAGKSSLLDCIANRNPQATGTVLINGQPWSPSTIKRSCYVMQDDLFYANLTVREHLNFQAQLRMGGSYEKRNTRVTQIISELGLNKVMNTPIGDVHVKGLSGGQRKRVTFATELLTNPSVLFVDEPTSGLDSFMAETVVKLMRQLAGKGRTVIATIHQPASDLFELFDKLYLLSDGRTVYNGPARTSIEYFGSQGYSCPTFINPTDYFMKQLVVTDADPNSKARVQGLIDAWAANHSDDKPKSAWINQTETDSVPFVEPSGSGSFAALGVLCRRNLFRLVRDIVGFRARIISTIVVSLVSGLVFLQLKVSQTGIQDFTGAIFFLSVNQFMFSANPEFITVPLEIPLVIREHNGGLYHVLVWYLSKNVSELAFQTFFPMLFLIPTFFLIGFTANATTFFTMYMFIVLAASSAVGLGYMVSCLSKRVDLAPTIGILFILPFMLFGGLFLNSESTPDYFIWLERISPIKYTFHGIMRAWWSQVSVIPCPAQANGQPGRCRNISGTDVLMNNHIDVDGLWKDALCLVGINLSFRVLGALFLWRRARQRNL